VAFTPEVASLSFEPVVEVGVEVVVVSGNISLIKIFFGGGRLYSFRYGFWEEGRTIVGGGI
jgi:hypothetical protein